MVNIIQVLDVFLKTPFRMAWQPGRQSGLNHAGEIVCHTGLTHGSEDHAARGFVIFVGDADRTKEHAVARIAADEGGDAFPVHQ